MPASERLQRVIDEVDSLRHKVNDHWQIPRDEAELLAQLVRIGRSMSVCEVGTSYGFSTLHLAAAVQAHGGHVHTFDIDPAKVAAATRHLTDAGLLESVTIHQGDARETLKAFVPDAPFDFVFIDANKPQSFAYFEAILPKCAARCVLVTDNTSTHTQELAPFVAHLRGLPGVSSCQVSVGNGFELTVRG